MFPETVYFRDNFFSTGVTDIRDEHERKVGGLDLQSMFSSGVQVLDEREGAVISGKFRFFSNTWIVFDNQDREIGELRAKFAFFSKRYEYERMNGEVLYIESPAFSREYTVMNDSDQAVADFERISGFFSSEAYRLHNRSGLPTEELIAVVMGVHGIQQRHNSAHAGTP